MSDGVTDSYNVCPLCGERMFGHDYIKCHEASVKCLTAAQERIEELESIWIDQEALHQYCLRTLSTEKLDHIAGDRAQMYLSRIEELETELKDAYEILNDHSKRSGEDWLMYKGWYGRRNAFLTRNANQLPNPPPDPTSYVIRPTSSIAEGDRP